MPGRGRGPDLLVDTSVAVAFTVADHDRHRATVDAVGGRRLGLAGHAAFETLSVLTRLPPPTRRTPATVVRLLATSFPYTRFLGAGGSATLLTELGAFGVAGRAVYDALVGACALEHALPLATRDRRALETYRLLDLDIELVD
jgi:predicted nucleic acid-binding protein